MVSDHEEDRGGGQPGQMPFGEEEAEIELPQEGAGNAQGGEAEDGVILIQGRKAAKEKGGGKSVGQGAAAPLPAERGAGGLKEQQSHKGEGGGQKGDKPAGKARKN